MQNSEMNNYFLTELTGRPVYSSKVIHIKKEIAVCVTGHREKSVIPYKNDPANSEITLFAVNAMLNGYLTALVKKGYTTILSGLAEGTDLWAANTALSIKRFAKECHLIGVMPFLKHYHRFSRQNKNILGNVEQYADYLVTTCDDPNVVYGPRLTAFTDPQIYRTRNYYIVDNSSVTVAFYNPNNPRSGTGQTVRYAQKQGKYILNFTLDDVYALIERTGGQRTAICSEMMNLKIDLPKAE